MLKEYFKKWAKRPMFSKVTDVLFILFIVAMLTPQGRMAIGGFVNNIKSRVSQPELLKTPLSIPPLAYTMNMLDVNGEPYDAGQLEDKVVFLNLWATWCPPCVGEMPGIQKLYDTYKDDPNVEFILLSNESPEIIKSFVNEKDYDFPVFSNKQQLHPIFESQSIPTTFLISKDKKIVVKEVGAMDWGGKTMQAFIDDLLIQ